MSLLIIGSTGTLGRQIVRRALNEGFQVKCMVRNFRKAAFLKEWGAELIYGDLTVPETIPVALYGVTAIIDSSTTRANDLYNAKQIDLKGKYILIESAKKAKIKHYIFFSILNAHKYPNIPLINLKLLINTKLIQSKINYTIFNLPGFFQGLITQYAVPILDQKSVWITGESASMSYINSQDVAKIVVKSLSITESKNKILPLVGRYSWTSLEIISLCEKLCGKRANTIKISVGILRLLKLITRMFQWSWNISERLAFIEILSENDSFDTSMKDSLKILQIENKDIETLESYLQDYFQKIMNKLKELNYQVIDQVENDNISNF
uniref:NmrA-like domain-containing protein n=1 Tax=Dictyurus purpurascens TaxID=189649 RepID=A0A4D6WRE6_9FLOR|nr:hypothetical protein [Dictyurus purpurascens]